MKFVMIYQIEEKYVCFKNGQNFDVLKLSTTARKLVQIVL